MHSSKGIQHCTGSPASARHLQHEHVSFARHYIKSRGSLGREGGNSPAQARRWSSANDMPAWRAATSLSASTKVPIGFLRKSGEDCVYSLDLSQSPKLSTNSSTLLPFSIWQNNTNA